MNIVACLLAAPALERARVTGDPLPVCDDEGLVLPVIVSHPFPLPFFSSPRLVLRFTSDCPRITYRGYWQTSASKALAPTRYSIPSPPATRVCAHCMRTGRPTKSPGSSLCSSILLLASGSSFVESGVALGGIKKRVPLPRTTYSHSSAAECACISCLSADHPVLFSFRESGESGGAQGGEREGRQEGEGGEGRGAARGALGRLRPRQSTTTC